MSSRSLSATAAVTVDTSVEVIPAPGAGAFINVQSIMFSNQSATDTFVDVLDGSTIFMRKMAVPAGIGNNPDISKAYRLEQNTALNVQCSAAVSTMNVTVFYDLEPSGNG